MVFIINIIALSGVRDSERSRSVGVATTLHILVGALRLRASKNTRRSAQREGNYPNLPVM